jgi:hypothetical protein
LFAAADSEPARVKILLVGFRFRRMNSTNQTEKVRHRARDI